jgi:hypothetical protein
MVRRIGKTLGLKARMKSLEHRGGKTVSKGARMSECKGTGQRVMHKGKGRKLRRVLTG